MPDLGCLAIARLTRDVTLMDSTCMSDLLLPEQLSPASAESVVISGLSFLYLLDPAPALHDPASLADFIVVAESTLSWLACRASSSCLSNAEGSTWLLQKGIDELSE